MYFLFTNFTIATVTAARKITDTPFNFYLFCANTYNWMPVRAVSRYIKKANFLEGKNVVAVTLGSGSTANSKRVFENIIKRKKANLIDSKTFWLLRPNAENRSKEKNVHVAKDMVNKWAKEIAMKIN